MRLKAEHTNLEKFETGFFLLDLSGSPQHQVLSTMSTVKQVANVQEIVPINHSTIVKPLTLRVKHSNSFLSLAVSRDRVFNSFYKSTSPPHVR